MFEKIIVMEKLGFLLCNFALAPRYTEEAAYKTLVRPLICTPITTQTEIVEKVQRTAARWTCRQISVGDMLDELEWPSL